MNIARMAPDVRTELFHHASMEDDYWRSDDARDERPDVSDDAAMQIAYALEALACRDDITKIHNLRPDLRKIAIKGLSERLIGFDDKDALAANRKLRGWANYMDPSIFPQPVKPPAPEKTKTVTPDIPGYFKYDDGGREAAGFKGHTRDCVTRSIVIATKLPYIEVYTAMNSMGKRERSVRRTRQSSARTGVYDSTSKRYLRQLGWKWHKVISKLRKEDLPTGRLIVKVRRHFVAVIDGVMHDTYDPSKGGLRSVFGYWTAPEVTA